MFSFFSVSVSTVTVASHQLDLTIRFTLDRYLSKETSTVESCACNHNWFIFFLAFRHAKLCGSWNQKIQTTRHIYDSLPVFYIQCLLLLDQRELYIHQWRWSTDILQRAFLTKSYWQIESIFRLFLFNLRKKRQIINLRYRDMKLSCSSDLRVYCHCLIEIINFSFCPIWTPTLDNELNSYWYVNNQQQKLYSTLLIFEKKQNKN